MILFSKLAQKTREPQLAEPGSENVKKCRCIETLWRKNKREDSVILMNFDRLNLVLVKSVSSFF